MMRLAVIPSDSIEDYLKGGYSPKWLREYYNPCSFFDEVYLLSPLENDASDVLGMKVIRTQPKDFKKRLRDLNINVVRAYGGNWACRMACTNKVPHIPVVVSVHDSKPERIYPQIKYADVVLCVSQAVRNIVQTKFEKKDRSWILPNRVDFDMMKPMVCADLDENLKNFSFKYKLLFVGRLDPLKNLDTLIKTLPLLGKDYGLIVVGQGDQSHYRQLAAQNNVEDQCVFIDSVEHEKLAAYYSMSDCLCTPSRAEGFGMVFIEALACEAVVVTSNIAPMNEFIKDGENGILVKDFENPVSLKQAIITACTQEDLRKKIKLNSRESVAQFERSHVDKLEADYYQRVIEMNRKNEFTRSFWKGWF